MIHSEKQTKKIGNLELTNTLLTIKSMKSSTSEVLTSIRAMHILFHIRNYGDWIHMHFTKEREIEFIRFSK